MQHEYKFVMFIGPIDLWGEELMTQVTDFLAGYAKEGWKVISHTYDGSRNYTFVLEKEK